MTRSIMLQEIHALREELYRLMELHKKLSHPAVVRKSQELDQLVIQWHMYADALGRVDKEVRII